MGAGSKAAPDYAGHSGAHTPGPWRVEPHDGYIPEEWGVEPIQVVGSDGDIIACNTAFYPTALAAKNARLIAAAPDLLAACRKLDAWWLEEFPEGPDGSREWAGGIGQLSEDTIEIWQQIRAAISKAERQS